jgi:hypothetical protein
MPQARRIFLNIVISVSGRRKRSQRRRRSPPEEQMECQVRLHDLRGAWMDRAAVALTLPEIRQFD